MKFSVLLLALFSYLDIYAQSYPRYNQNTLDQQINSVLQGDHQNEMLSDNTLFILQALHKDLGKAYYNFRTNSFVPYISATSVLKVLDSQYQIDKSCKIGVNIINSEIFFSPHIGNNDSLRWNKRLNKYVNILTFVSQNQGNKLWLERIMKDTIDQSKMNLEDFTKSNLYRIYYKDPHTQKKYYLSIGEKDNYPIWVESDSAEYITFRLRSLKNSSTIGPYTLNIEQLDENNHSISITRNFFDAEPIIFEKYPYLQNKVPVKLLNSSSQDKTKDGFTASSTSRFKFIYKPMKNEISSDNDKVYYILNKRGGFLCHSNVGNGSYMNKEGIGPFVYTYPYGENLSTNEIERPNFGPAIKPFNPTDPNYQWFIYYYEIPGTSLGAYLLYNIGAKKFATTGYRGGTFEGISKASVAFSDLPQAFDINPINSDNIYSTIEGVRVNYKGNNNNDLERQYYLASYPYHYGPLIQDDTNLDSSQDRVQFTFTEADVDAKVINDAKAEIEKVLERYKLRTVMGTPATTTSGDNIAGDKGDEGWYYATFYADNMVTVPQDVEVWKVVQEMGKGKLKAQKVNLVHNVIPNGQRDNAFGKADRSNKGNRDKKAVILRTKNSGDINLTPVWSIEDRDGTPFNDNLLEGTTQTNVPATNKLVFGNGNLGVGFYPFSGANIPTYKAYLPVTSGSAPIVLNFGDVATNIQNTLAPTAQKDVYYDLSGRKVSNPTKGIYLVNGKKVIL